MHIVDKKATKGSKCKFSRPECFKMTNFDRLHREAMGVRGLDNVSNYSIAINVFGVLSATKL